MFTTHLGYAYCFIFRERKLKLKVLNSRLPAIKLVTDQVNHTVYCNKMAKVGGLLNDSECLICMNVLKDPVTTQCGRTYCKTCINDYCDQDGKQDHDSCCPQCSQMSTLQPASDIKLTENTGRKKKISSAQPDAALSTESDELTAVSKDGPSTQTSDCPPVISDKQDIRSEGVAGQPDGNNSAPASKVKMSKRVKEKLKTYKDLIKEREEELQKLKDEMVSLKGSTQATVEDCETFFSELVERTSSKLRERIKAQEGAMLREAEGHLRTLEEELVDLRGAEAEHKTLDFLEYERPHYFQTLPSLTSAYGTVQRSVYRMQKQLEATFEEQLEGFFSNADFLLGPHTMSSLADRTVEDHELEEYKHLESVKTKEMLAQMEDILDRLTPENFHRLMKVVGTYPITTEERLRGMVDLIYEEAISDYDNSEVYAQMCKRLQLRKVPSSDKPEETLNFRKLMLNRCLVDFEKRKTEDMKKLRDKRDAATKKEERSLQEEKLEEAFTEALDKAVGNIKFICEFFKLHMMTEAQMHEFIMKLLIRGGPISITCLSTMLSTIGKDLDHEKAKPKMDKYYKKIEVIIKTKKPLLSSEVFCELHMLVKHRMGKEEPKDPKLIKTQEMYSKMEYILNFINRDNYQLMMRDVHTFPINTEERLKGVIDLIYRKAISDPDNSETYANMCRCLMELKVPISNEPGTTVNFRKLLLNRCQIAFEQEPMDGLREKQRELETATEDEDRIQLRKEIRVITSEVRDEAVGNVKLLCELFKLKMVTEAIMHDCIVKLLKRAKEEDISLSCVFTLLSTAGEALDVGRAKPRMDQYYNQMEKLAKERTWPPHLRSELQELLNRRGAHLRTTDQKIAASNPIPGQVETGPEPAR